MWEPSLLVKEIKHIKKILMLKEVKGVVNSGKDI